VLSLSSATSERATHQLACSPLVDKAYLEVPQRDEDLVRKAADEAQAEPHEVVLLNEVVQVDAEQLKADAQVAAEVKVLLVDAAGGQSSSASRATPLAHRLPASSPAVPDATVTAALRPMRTR
jgi:hypothetical protein